MDMAALVASAGARLASAEAYALARVVPGVGQQVTCSALFSDYRVWCGTAGLVALREAAFISAFEELARTVGIPLRQRGGNLSFMDVALRPGPMSAASGAVTWTEDVSGSRGQR